MKETDFAVAICYFRFAFERSKFAILRPISLELRAFALKKKVDWKPQGVLSKLTPPIPKQQIEGLMAPKRIQ